jgi:hypothetical protein
MDASKRRQHGSGVAVLLARGAYHFPDGSEEGAAVEGLGQDADGGT